MKLPSAPTQYSAGDQTRTRSVIEASDAQSYKRGQDVEISDIQRLIIKDSVTGTRYRLSVASGVWVFTPL